MIHISRWMSGKSWCDQAVMVDTPTNTDVFKATCVECYDLFFLACIETGVLGWDDWKR